MLADMGRETVYCPFQRPRTVLCSPTWDVKQSSSTAPLHALHCDVIRNYRRVTRKRAQYRIFMCKFFVWNDVNSPNQTSTTGNVRLFQSCKSNGSRQGKTWTFRINLCHIYNVSSLSKPTVFLARDPGSMHVQCDKQAMRIQIRRHCYSHNLSDYIKTHGLISTKLW